MSAVKSPSIYSIITYSSREHLSSSTQYPFLSLFCYPPSACPTCMDAIQVKAEPIEVSLETQYPEDDVVSLKKRKLTVTVVVPTLREVNLRKKQINVKQEATVKGSIQVCLPTGFCFGCLTKIAVRIYRRGRTRNRKG